MYLKDWCKVNVTYLMLENLLTGVGVLLSTGVSKWHSCQHMPLLGVV